MHLLGAIAEFERERIRERVVAGLQRARAQGKRLGRPQSRLPIENGFSASRAVGAHRGGAAQRLAINRQEVASTDGCCL